MQIPATGTECDFNCMEILDNDTGKRRNGGWARCPFMSANARPTHHPSIPVNS